MRTCPFCGGDKLSTMSGSDVWRIECVNCGAFGPKGASFADAMVSWTLRRPRPLDDGAECFVKPPLDLDNSAKLETRFDEIDKSSSPGKSISREIRALGKVIRRKGLSSE